MLPFGAGFQSFRPDRRLRILGQYGLRGRRRRGNGNTVMAYLPSSRPVKIDMRKLSGTQAACWWYNPANGSATAIGTYPTSGARTFTPPSTGDWVLVIDDAALNLPAPGSVPFNPLPI